MQLYISDIQHCDNTIGLSVEYAEIITKLFKTPFLSSRFPGNKEEVFLQGKCLLLPAEGSSAVSSLSNVHKHLLSVFQLYDDIVQFVFAKLGQTVFMESSSDIINGNIHISFIFNYLVHFMLIYLIID